MIKDPKENGSRILDAVREEVKTEGKDRTPRQVSSGCDSYCSGDNYCSDWHDA